MLRIQFANIENGVKRPAIFLDRDGVINRRRPSDYVLDWSQFEFVPGIRHALRGLASLKLPMILISNQAAVGKGLLDVTDLEKITEKMCQEIAADGTQLTAAYYCTHRPEENCSCRKPKPALLLAAAEDLNIDLGRSIFVGDSDTDVQAAYAAGCIPILFGYDCERRSRGHAAVVRARGAGELLDLISTQLRDDESISSDR